MTMDLTARAKDYAAYTPSLQIHSAERIAGSDDNLRKGGLPASLHAADFDFLRPNNPHWHYKWVLATAGHFKDKTKPNAILNRGCQSFAVLDSSGFQLGVGTMKEIVPWRKLAHDPALIMRLWREHDVKMKIIRWLCNNADVALTIDIPIWSRTKPNSPFRNLTAAELTQLSVENLKLICDVRGRFRQAKFINVLQGDSIAEEEAWFKAVKCFPFEGWSLAGHVGQMGGIGRVLRRILLLRDEKLLDPPRDHLHILRLSRVRWAPLVTAIQTAVRKTVNENFTITFDSSSPYKVAGVGAQYASLNTFGGDLEQDWSIRSSPFPLGFGYANGRTCRPLNTAWGKHLPHPLVSPIAQQLAIGDINVRTGAKEIRTLDGFGDEFLINHNVWVYVMAHILANEAVFADKPIAPQIMVDAAGLIGELFETADWRGMLQRILPVLAFVVGDGDREPLQLAA